MNLNNVTDSAGAARSMGYRITQEAVTRASRRAAELEAAGEARVVRNLGIEVVFPRMEGGVPR